MVASATFKGPNGFFMPYFFRGAKVESSKAKRIQSLKAVIGEKPHDGFMWLVYLPTFSWFVYGFHVGKYTIDIALWN